jgi:hypothetical protein
MQRAFGRSSKQASERKPKSCSNWRASDTRVRRQGLCMPAFLSALRREIWTDCSGPWPIQVFPWKLEDRSRSYTFTLGRRHSLKAPLPADLAALASPLSAITREGVSRSIGGCSVGSPDVDRATTAAASVSPYCIVRHRSCRRATLEAPQSCKRLSPSRRWLLANIVAPPIDWLESHFKSN